MTQPKTINKLFALQSALCDPDLSRGTDTLMLAILIEYQNPTYGYSWPSIETLEQVSGLGERTTRNSLRRLESAGYVQTQCGGGRNNTNRYRVPLDRFDEAPLKGRITFAKERRHGDAGFSEAGARNDVSETRHEDAETRHDDDTKPGTTMPPKPTYGNHLTEKPSACAASNSGSTRKRDEKTNDAQTMAYLRKMDQSLKVARRDGHSFRGEKAIDGYRELLEIAGEEYSAGDPIKGWAHRLSEELVDLMDEQTFGRIAA
ncbi:helix-turn-helix domain-containing protein [Mesorhizobium sp. M1342]|uniref:helix-turn-helix domain-containing protein n=1 Tax=Mesorhizobium sp. M1342 TaxID=2957088 RepID=UPI00333AA740